MFRAIRHSCLVAAAALPFSLAVCGARADGPLTLDQAVKQQTSTQQNSNSTGQQQQQQQQQQQNTAAPSASDQITDDQIGAMLTAMGYEPKAYPSSAGGHYFVICVSRGDWKVNVTVSVSSDHTNIWLCTPLVDLDPAKVSPAALLKILEQNTNLGPSSFATRTVNNGPQLWFSTPFQNRGVTAGVLRGNIEQLVTTVQNTYPLWQDKVLMAGTTPAPAPGGTTTANAR